MKRIEVKVLAPESIEAAERMMLAGATLTQHGHEIHDMASFLEVYDQDRNQKRVRRLAGLPHPALQKLGTVDAAIIGLSRRALAQITRHQNEIKFIAGSLQYSDYSGVQRFVVPPGLDLAQTYRLETAYQETAKAYDDLIAAGVDRDAAGYAMPQGFRTSLLMSATPYQLKHMIRLRACRRNTPEVRYIFLLLYKELMSYAPELFEDALPPCWAGECPEGKMSCGRPFAADYEEEIKELLK